MKCFLLLFVLTMKVCSAGAVDFESWTYRQDFENKQLNAWSGYPPTQDTAFEMPYLYPGNFLPDDKNLSLCKILYPASNNIQLTGAVKRLPMRLDKSSSIRFRYYIKTVVKPSWLGIDLPLADGERIRAQFPSPPINQWVNADYRLSDILSSAGWKQLDKIDITALAITVRFEGADTDMPIMLGLDDFEITGYKPAAFTITKPNIKTLPEWEDDISLHHFRVGEPLEISARSLNSSPDRVNVTVRRFDRPDSIVAQIPMRKNGDVWNIAKPVLLDAKKYPAGLYEAEIIGAKGSETTVRSVLAFTVIDPSRFSSHPRLWFTNSTIDEFRRSLEKNPQYLAYIRNTAKGVRARYSPDIPYDLNYFPAISSGTGSAYETRIVTIPRGVFANTLTYIMDGDREAGEWAKSALVSLCRWPTWTSPYLLSRGHYTYYIISNAMRDLAKSYDMLYDQLSTEERLTIREGFFRNGIDPAYKSYVVADMVTCHESNWLTSIVGGAITDCCAIMGDIDDSSSLEPYLTGLLMKLNAHMKTVYGGDSGVIEGYGYGYATLRHYTEYLPIINQTLGIDLGWKLKDQYNEALWTGNHDRNLYFTFGDSEDTGGNTFSSFPWLVERFRDPELAWFMDVRPLSPSSYTLPTLLCKTEDVPREKPDLTGARWFRRTGTVVFRSGNGPDPFIFTFRCGPFGNHQHLDQGTFYLHDRGETFLTEFGLSNYYQYPYPTHVSQPVGHNCILVDGNPHSQRTGDHQDYAIGMKDYARVISFAEGKSLAWANGDLSPLYLGNVNSLTRGVLWIAPRTVLILDRFKAKKGEATMESLFHGPIWRA